MLDTPPEGGLVPVAALYDPLVNSGVRYGLQLAFMELRSLIMASLG